MEILFNEEYIFQRKTDGKIYIMKCLPVHVKEYSNRVDIKAQNYICTGKIWRKVSADEFNKLGVTFVGRL